MALRQLARTLRVPRCPASYPRLPSSAPRAWSAAPARSRPFSSSHHQDRRPTRDWEQERSKARKQIEEELRRNKKWEAVAGVASGVVIFSAGLIIIIGASGAIGLVISVPFGIIFTVGAVGAAIDKMKQEAEEDIDKMKQEAEEEEDDDVD